MTVAGVAEQEFPAGALYVVGLPIGNMGDITLRALWVLSRADTVVAEDTRETRKLLDKFGINVRLLSVREHNEVKGAEQVTALLGAGEPTRARPPYPIRGPGWCTPCARPATA